MIIDQKGKKVENFVQSVEAKTLCCWGIIGLVSVSELRRCST